MKYLGKIFAVGFLIILGILQAPPTVAQQQTTAQAPRDTQTIPGALSLFFKDMGQRVQLWFTFNEEADTDLRVTFAEENLSLANLIASAQLGREAEIKATKLVERANVLTQTVVTRMEAWSEEDLRARAELVEHTDAYFTSAEEILVAIKTKFTDSDEINKINTTLENLKMQKISALKFIGDAGEGSRGVVDSSGILRPIREKDRDRDGIDDEAEADLGLSTENFDTDGDGLSDRMEIEKYGTDPNNKDTDGDGFKDAVEILEGYNPRGAGNSSGVVVTTSLQFINTKLVKPELKAETFQYLQAVVKNYEVKKN